MSRATTSQRLFHEAVLGADTTQLATLLTHEGAPARERIEIYREHCIESLTGALGEVYSVTRRLVGDELFRQLARVHIDVRPPRDPRLSRYGDDLAATLARLDACAGLPYLADVARLEWAVHEANEAAESTVAVEESPAAIDLAAVLVDAEVTFIPSFRLLRSAWRIDEIWRAHQRGEFADLLYIESGPVFLQVACDAGGPYLRILAPGEHALRAVLLARGSIEEAGGAGLVADPAMDLACALATLLSEGIVAAITPRPGSVA